MPVNSRSSLSAAPSFDIGTLLGDTETFITGQAISAPANIVRPGNPMQSLSADAERQQGRPSHVLCLGDGLQVFGIDAKSVSTLMVDVQAIWNLAHEMSIKDPMGQSGSKNGPGGYPVPAVNDGTAPLPASRFRDFVPSKVIDFLGTSVVSPGYVRHDSTVSKFYWNFQ